jgi:UPF0716 family protein affecting phage T7 exclusion
MESSSFFNTVAFLLTTLFYSMMLRPELTLNKMTTSYLEYKSDNYLYLGAYLLLVLIVQFSVNASIIANNCGGSMKENVGAAGSITFIPWLLIFGVMMLILVIYPGFKSAFSDVVGYYYVSTKANDILTKILKDSRIESTMDTKISADDKKKIETTADAILKIMGNSAVVINQIVPENFLRYWDTLKPLMKDEYITNEPLDMKSELFELVVTRDYIGEIMWYMYTGVLLTFLVGLKIASRGCDSSPETMSKNLQAYKEAQAAEEVKKGENKKLN